MVSEAPESNAGDDFHVLWTIKRSFVLLNFEEDGLKSITVEGILAKDSAKLDPEGKSFLGVDIAEYYGGQSFLEANRVVVSQLKYSTRRVYEPFTFSELYRGKKSSDGKGSIIHRLSQMFQAYLSEYGREKVLGKLEFKLISIRSFSQSHLAQLHEIQQYLGSKSTQTQLTTLYKRFPKSEAGLSKMQKASGLKPLQFVDFLQIFDVSDCGTASSYYQEIETVEALRSIGVTDSRTQFKSFYWEVVQRMLPPAVDRNRNQITALDLMGWLKTSLEGLFPVNPAFERIENWVQRDQLESIIKEIMDCPASVPICLHGAAGIGKSSTSLLIKEQFPNHSEVVLFDCYGGGSYLDISDSRHLHKEALVQISNELAKSIGSRLLVPGSQLDDYIVVREFKNRMAEALSILRKRNPEAKLVILVDAADNSVTASKEYNSRSFVQSLLKEKNWPAGFRLVVTCRTYRKDILDLPSGYTDIPLKLFNLNESKAHISSVFPSVNEDQIKEFHQLTNGNPRVQSYALSLKREGIEQTVNYLKPSGKKVKDIFEDKTAEAAMRLGGNGQKIIDLFFSYLIALPRPVPISLLSESTDLEPESLRDLTVDIWHGLIVNEHKQTIAFRDEDFEDYVKDKYDPTPEIRENIARVFLKKARESTYAAIHLAHVLYQAGDEEGLIDIVLNQKYLELFTDPVRSQFVEVERTKLAMKVSLKANNTATFFKLAFLAADASKVDQALQNLLISNPELIASFGDNDTLQQLLVKSETASWAGSFHYQLAATYSRKRVLHDKAKRHLKSAEEWLRWLQRQENHDSLRNHRITDEDIANGAETVLHLLGVKTAHRWLRRWTPRSAVIKAIDLLLQTLLRRSEYKRIIIWAREIDPPIFVKLLILEKTSHINEDIYDLKSVGRDLEILLAKRIKLNLYLWKLVISFCELWWKRDKQNKTRIISLLRYLETTLPDHIPTFYGRDDDYERDPSLRVEVCLRKQALIAILENKEMVLREIYPEQLRNIDDEEDHKVKSSLRNRLTEFNRFYKHALEVFVFRAEAFQGLRNKDFAEQLTEICNSVQSNWELKHYNNWALHQLEFLAGILLDALTFLNATKEMPRLIAKSFTDSKSNGVSLRFQICDSLLPIPTLHEEVYSLLNEVDEILENSQISAQEIVDRYTRCARLLNYIDPQSAKYYFEKAVEAVKEVDVEAQDQIKALYELSKVGLSQHNAKLSYEFGRFVEHTKVRLEGYDHFPVREGIIGMANIDPASSFAICCRWNHRYVAELTQEILYVLKVALDKNFLIPQIASSLFPFNPNYWRLYLELVVSLVEKYDQEGDSEQKSSFIKQIHNDLAINCPTQNKPEVAGAIYEKIKSGNLINSEVLEEFGHYVNFVNSIDPSSESPEAPIQKNQILEDKFQFDLEQVEGTSSSSMSEALREIERSDDSYFSRNKIDRLFEQIKEACLPTERVDHLNAILNIDSELFTFWTFEKALSERLQDWSAMPAVRQWKKENIEKALILWFSYFHFSSDYINFEGITNLGKIFSVEPSDLRSIVKKMMPEKINELSASSIYQTIGFLAPSVSQTENEEVLKCVLEKTNSRIKENFGDGQWQEELRPPDSSNEVIAKTIRFTLGQPDLRVRWRGLHALRRLVNKGDLDIFTLLLNQQNEKDCYPFQHKGYKYFWISAKLYLWIGIYRLSQECPENLLDFAQLFINELKNDVLPHALIIKMIKGTCLNLFNHDSAIYSSPEVDYLRKVLESPFDPVKEKTLTRKQRKYAEREWKFDFDDLDTLGHWYSNLGRCFNLSEYDVADIADKYIAEKWGYTGDVWQDNFVKAFDSRDNSLMRHYKSDIPTIESLQSYYEYHAMCCAATDLLSKEPLLDSTYDFETWAYWLESHTLTMQEGWLSDLRDPIPLHKRFWKSEFRSIDKHWRKNIKEEDYTSALGLHKFQCPRTIVAYGGYTRHFGDHYEATTIRSALVSPKTSVALLRALQTCEDNHDYRIPLEDDELELQDSPFEMFGWLKEVYWDSEGLDMKDPFYNDVGKNYVRLGSEVEKFFPVRFANFGKEAYYNEELVASLKNWSDLSEHRRSGELESDGVWLEVSTSFLLDFLAKRGVDIIIECDINRSFKDPGEYSRYERSNTAILFLIKSNGKVTTLSGSNYRIG